MVRREILRQPFDFVMGMKHSASSQAFCMRCRPENKVQAIGLLMAFHLKCAHLKGKRGAIWNKQGRRNFLQLLRKHPSIARKFEFSRASLEQPYTCRMYDKLVRTHVVNTGEGGALCGRR
jgi:hypothetical protein